MALNDPRLYWLAGLLAVLLAGLLGSLRMPDRARSRLRLAVLVCVIAGLAFYLTVVNPVFELINQGLDLKGGVHVVLEAQDLPDAPVTEEAMRTVQAILEARVNALGVTEPRVEREGARRIVVELPGIADPEQAMADIGRTAYLEFAEAFDLYLVDLGSEPSAVEAALVGLGVSGVRAAQILAEVGLGPQLVWGDLEFDESAFIQDVLGDVGAVLLREPQAVLTGADLKPGSAKAVFDHTNRPAVSLTFAGPAVQEFAALTARRVGQPVYILLDGQLVQAPNVTEPITTGQAQITGYATLEDAFRMAVVLNSGALPVRLVPLAPQVVSATLGADSIARSKTAGLMAILAVVGFMVLFYRAVGLLANVALALYIMIVLIILAAINATLTLPGVAGLLLSVGMAVDANVITFERIREELGQGKTIRSAVESGYQRALGTIIDSNITTLIAGFVLFYLGSGPIRGFAVTLIVGIVASMITAVYISRFLVRLAARGNLLQDTRLMFGFRPLGGEDLD